MIVLPIYLQMVYEYNAMEAGLSLAPLSLSMFAVALLAGKKAGTRRPASIMIAAPPRRVMSSRRLMTNMGIVSLLLVRAHRQLRIGGRWPRTVGRAARFSLARGQWQVLGQT
jgi:hypothetical protein